MNLSRTLDLIQVSAPASGASVRTRKAAPEPGDRGGGVFAQPLVPIAATVAVAFLTMLTIRLGQAPDKTVVLWIANAVAIGAWLRSGKGQAFDLCFGALMAFGIMVGEFLSGYSPATSALLTAANMIEVVIAVFLIRKLVPGLAVISVNSALRVLTALSIAALIGGIVGALWLFVLRDTPFAVGLRIWSFGHTLGLFLVVPLLISFSHQTLETLKKPVRLLESVGLIGGTAAAAYVLSFHVPAPVAFLINPLLLVVAVRTRVYGLSLAMLAVTFCVLGSLLHGYGPGATTGLPIHTRIVMAQLMLAFAFVPYLMVAALVEERDRLWAQARADLARADRASAAKSRLLANVAHEIKSPVGGIIGIGELWSSGQLGEVNATQTEMATMLVKTARQVETLAHDLLDVARAEAGTVKVEIRPTEIVSLVEDVRRSLTLRPEAQTVVMQVEAETPSLIAQADSQRLRQVIDNLAVNALKYGSTGGSVIFTIKTCPLGVRIEVTDKGPGLSLEKQAQLFEPFNRLGLERTTIEGHGVGLALARLLVELQGGEIGVISAPGEGATFWIELPTI